jgi:hypothetical protein
MTKPLMAFMMLVMLLFLGGSELRAQETKAYGEGNDSCAEFTAAHQAPVDSLRQYRQDGWLMGWVSAASGFRQGQDVKKVKEANKSSGGGLRDWSKKRCVEQPSDSLRDAAGAYVEQQPAPRDNAFRIVGYGSLECWTWLNLDLDLLVARVLNDGAAGWVAGWVSTAAYYRAHPDSMRELDVVAFTRAVKNQCADKPRDKVADAALSAWRNWPQK